MSLIPESTLGHTAEFIRARATHLLICGGLSMPSTWSDAQANELARIPVLLDEITTEANVEPGSYDMLALARNLNGGLEPLTAHTAGTPRWAVVIEQTAAGPPELAEVLLVWRLALSDPPATVSVGTRIDLGDFRVRWGPVVELAPGELGTGDDTTLPSVEPYGSIYFRPNNGAESGTVVRLPVFTNIFGDGTTGASGAIAVRCRVQPNAFAGDSSSGGVFGNVIPILCGNVPTAGGRRLALYLVREGIQSNTGSGWRFYWAARDQSGNPIGTGNMGGQPSVDGAQCDINHRGDLEALVVLRRTGNDYEMLTIQPLDISPRKSGLVTRAGSPGIANTSTNMMLGAAPTSGNPPGTLLAQSFLQNALVGDVIQLDGVGGTDAEWMAVARGADPNVVWPSNLAVHYRLGSTTDLAKTSGSRAYAAGEIIASAASGANLDGVADGPCMRGSNGVAGNGIRALGNSLRMTHALHPDDLVAVRNAGTGQTGLMTRSATMIFPVVVSGNATHVEVLVQRASDNVIVQPWTRRSASPFTGHALLEIPNVPTSPASGYKIWVRREDDRNTVSLCSNGERVGVVVAFGPAQSEMDIFARFTGTGTADIAPSAAAEQLCTFVMSRASASVPSGAYNHPTTQGLPLRSKSQAGAGAIAFANRWAARYNVPLEMLHMAVSGQGYQNFLQNAVPTAYAIFGDGTNQYTGRVTDMLLASHKRISAYFVMWYANDIAKTDAAHRAGWNELWAGIEDTVTGGYTVAFADRVNLNKANIVYPPLMIIAPAQRRSATTFGTLPAQLHAKRAWQRLAGLGGELNSTIRTYSAGWIYDIRMESASGPHQSTATARGVVRWGAHAAMAVEEAVGLLPGIGYPTLANPVRSGNTITLDIVPGAGGTIFTPEGGSDVREFWVSEDGGTTWVELTTIGSASRSGNTITLTRTSGNWAAGTRIRYLYGLPASGFANEADSDAVIDKFLYESVPAYSDYTGRPSAVVNGLIMPPTFGTGLIAA